MPPGDSGQRLGTLWAVTLEAGMLPAGRQANIPRCTAHPPPRPEEEVFVAKAGSAELEKPRPERTDSRGRKPVGLRALCARQDQTRKSTQLFILLIPQLLKFKHKKGKVENLFSALFFFPPGK